LISSRFRFDHGKALAVAGSGAQLRAIEAVKAKLNLGEYRLRDYPCPCGAPAQDCLVAETDRYGLPLSTVLCLACGTLRLDPYLDEQSLEDFYVNFYQSMYNRAWGLGDYQAHQYAYGRKLLSATRERLPPSGWVFEVGCGAGGGLRAFQEAGYQVAGCDYSAELIAEARQRGVEHACHGTLDDLARGLGGVKADLIYLHHVFEHLNDPLAFLEECRRHLRPGGRVVTVVPDVSRIDRFAVPDGDLLVFIHIAHKYNFTFKGLSRLCARAGYAVSLLSPDPSIKTAASVMPELWAEARGDAPAAETEGVGSDAGEGMLRYLKATERRYARRRYRRQVAARLAPLSPRRIIERLRPGS
jgi:SAM-dependent methyltransferase